MGGSASKNSKAITKNTSDTGVPNVSSVSTKAPISAPALSSQAISKLEQKFDERYAKLDKVPQAYTGHFNNIYATVDKMPTSYMNEISRLNGEIDRIEKRSELIMSGLFFVYFQSAITGINSDDNLTQEQKTEMIENARQSFLGLANNLFVKYTGKTYQEAASRYPNDPIAQEKYISQQFRTIYQKGKTDFKKIENVVYNDFPSLPISFYFGNKSDEITAIMSSSEEGL